MLRQKKNLVRFFFHSFVWLVTAICTSTFDISTMINKSILEEKLTLKGVWLNNYVVIVVHCFLDMRIVAGCRIVHYKLHRIIAQFELWMNVMKSAGFNILESEIILRCWLGNKLVIYILLCSLLHFNYIISLNCKISICFILNVVLWRWRTWTFPFRIIRHYCPISKCNH